MSRQQEDSSFKDSIVHVAQANIETGHNRKYVVPDLQEAKKNSNVVTLNEMYSPKYHLFMRAVFKPTKWGCYPSMASDPILWKRKHFKVKEKRSFHLHDGIKGFLGPRKLRLVLLEDRTTGALFYVTNKHYVSRVFNGKEDAKEALRRERWAEGFDNEMRLYTHLNRNYPVIANGDYNRVSWAPPVFLGIHDEGLSKVFATPRRLIRIIDKSRIKGNSNHPCFKATLRIGN